MITKLTPHISLFLAIALFTGFGLFHLSKFETTDEHFWKYDRIEKYYNGWRELNLKKTRINDKPGVTVALVSGLGLPFSPDVNTHRNFAAEEASGFYDEKKDKNRKLFTIYNTDQTERINRVLRLPVLLFNAFVILPLIFWLLTKIFVRSDKDAHAHLIPHFTILLIGLSPILIGMSQIINPDALLWGFATVALLSFMALLKTHAHTFVLLTGVFTGFALLSKYTANLLFILFVVLLFTWPIFAAHDDNVRTFYRRMWRRLGLITILAWVVFVIFMPAVILKPEHFLYGTLLSPALKPVIVPLVAAVALMLADVFLAQARWTQKAITFLQSHAHWLLRVLAIPVVIIFALSFVNAWSDTSFFSVGKHQGNEP